ncbi:ATP-binding protein, partial [Lachnospiraceae bacterium OttesenSCG-928-D06]|nr:ATP-binding protein [Lachnospiraceae bacterium OttesenSCG-928-D06]
MGLSSGQYEEIMRGYEAKKSLGHRLLMDRRDEVYKKIPGFMELCDSIGSISVSYTSRVIDGDKDAMGELKQRLYLLREEKKRMLSQGGFPEDYLEAVYECEDCQDSGYLVESSDFGKKGSKCHCFRRQELRLLYEQSNIQEMISRDNFSALSYEYYEGDHLKRFENAVKVSKNFVENFHSDYHNLFFYGTVGTGKSFLSGCIAKELLEQGLSVIYFSSLGLFETLARFSFDIKAKEELHQFYQDLYHCDLIIIDDLGTEITNAFVTSQLFSCLNERHLRKKATIISTNLSLEELRDRYSDRIFSRITSNFQLCKLTGAD